MLNTHTRHVLCPQHPRTARRRAAVRRPDARRGTVRFTEGEHASRSERYTYIRTIDVLRGLRNEGFEPFMVAQGQSRVERKAELTKHMIRMRHVRSDSGHISTKPEANQISLINSHDGASSNQMLAGVFRL